MLCMQHNWMCLLVGLPGSGMVMSSPAETSQCMHLVRQGSNHQGITCSAQTKTSACSCIML